MNYDLSEEQTIIKDTAHKFLSKECPGEFVRAMAMIQGLHTRTLAWHD